MTSPEKSNYRWSTSGPRRPRGAGLLPWLNVLLAAAAVVAVASLVLEYGFRRPLVDVASLRVANAAAVAAFVLDRLARLLLSSSRGRYLRENWLDFLLMVVLGVSTALLARKALSAGALYVVVTQAYLLVTLLLRAVGANLAVAEAGIHPRWMLLGSFAFLCLAGSALLMLPAARAAGRPAWHYADALFTATSATCVTGLITLRTGMDFSPFGQAVILALIQLGGLGILLFGTVLGMLVGKGLSLRSSESLGQVYGSNGAGQIQRMLKYVIFFTFLAEILGAAAMLPAFLGAPDAAGTRMGPGKAAWYSLFHSVSAFCNAGFSLYDGNLMEGVADGWDRPLRDRAAVLGVFAPLIVLGGLGFPTLIELLSWLRERLRRLFRGRATVRGLAPRAKSSPRRLSLHARIVLLSTVVLLIGGAAVLLLIEPTGRREPVIGRHTIYRSDVPGEPAGTWRTMSAGQRVGAAAFQSVSARTAGFNTIDMSELSSAGKVWMCGLMIVGGSPGSTAGGMKTVTVVVLLAGTWSVLRRRREVELFRRSLGEDLVRKALAVAVLYLLLLAAVTILLAVSMRDAPLVNVFFEACSACGTVGLSTGVTGQGHFLMTRAVTIAAMFLGRVGPITGMLALTSGLRTSDYSYPREPVQLG